MGSNTGSAPYGPFVALNNLASEAAYRNAMAQQSGEEWGLKKQGLGLFGEGMMGQQMPQVPQPPEPGQPSVATRPFPTVGDRPMTDQHNYSPPPGGIPASATSMDVGMQGLPAGPTPPAGAAPASGAASQGAVQPVTTSADGKPQYSLQQMLQVIKQKHPNADPAAVAEAINYLHPFLVEQDKAEWNNASADMKMQIAQLNYDKAMAVQGEITKRADVKNEISKRRLDIMESGQMQQFKNQLAKLDLADKRLTMDRQFKQASEMRLQKQQIINQMYSYAIAQGQTAFVGDEDAQAEYKKQIDAEMAQIKAQALPDVSGRLKGPGDFQPDASKGSGLGAGGGTGDPTGEVMRRFRGSQQPALQ